MFRVTSVNGYSDEKWLTKQLTIVTIAAGDPSSFSRIKVKINAITQLVRDVTNI